VSCDALQPHSCAYSKSSSSRHFCLKLPSSPAQHDLNPLLSLPSSSHTIGHVAQLSPLIMLRRSEIPFPPSYPAICAIYDTQTTEAHDFGLSRSLAAPLAENHGSLNFTPRGTECAEDRVGSILTQPRTDSTVPTLGPTPCFCQAWRVNTSISSNRLRVTNLWNPGIT